MGELREIVDIAAVERLFLLLAVVGPIAGLVIGAAVGSRRQRLRHGTVSGLLFGLLGTLNWLLWHVYNALTDANGLDSVKGLAINLVLFVGVGAALGFGYNAWLRRMGSVSHPDEVSGK
jgi:lipopolysaccharide export LptBFGC system permease protein LptF